MEEPDGLQHRENRPCHTAFTLVSITTLLLCMASLFEFERERGGAPSGLLRHRTGSLSSLPRAHAHMPPSGANYLGADVPGCAPDDAPGFWAMGVTVSTDKVTLPESHIRMSHSYQFPYEHWLRPLRCKRLKVLEIGLGCDMSYRAMDGKYAATQEGHSIPLWLAFLPHANLTVIEFVAKCAEDFMANDPLKIGSELQRRVQMFRGDQSRKEDLLAVVAQPSVGTQDVIIDDGGHSMQQQLVTLRTLLPWVKPGGIFIMEDLQSSYSDLNPYWKDQGKAALMMDCS